jgi:hypothetical protein
MAQSPPACQRRIVWVSAPGDYAIRNSNHTPDGTIEFINDLNRDPVIHRWRYKIDLPA